LLVLLQITFAEELKITEMISGEGEKVPFTQSLYPEGNVEDWLLEVERVMRESLRKILSDALVDYKEVCSIFIRWNSSFIPCIVLVQDLVIWNVAVFPLGPLVVFSEHGR